MARVVGGIITSHIPAIGNAITRNLRNEPYWKEFFEGYEPAKRWLDEVKPDIAIVIYNDHGLNFFLDKMPTFAIGAADVYNNADEGWGLATLHAFKGDPQFSWHLIESAINDEFDITICQDMLIDHGFIVPMSVMWHEKPAWPVRAVPLAINTVQFPIPSAKRCYNLGKSIGKAIESYPEDLKVVIFGTGGMSHQLAGERAGFINKKFDTWFMDKIVNDPLELTKLTSTDLIRDAGAEGVELIMWLTMRGAMRDKIKVLHSYYHIPVSNTASGIMVLENT